MGKYLASIMDDSTVIWDEVIKSNDEEIKTIATNFNEKNITFYITISFYVLFVMLLIIVALLTAVSIYCYLIKHERKHLLPFHSLIIS